MGMIPTLEASGIGIVPLPVVEATRKSPEQNPVRRVLGAALLGRSGVPVIDRRERTRVRGVATAALR
jgi:hypothetical protein